MGNIPRHRPSPGSPHLSSAQCNFSDNSHLSKYLDEPDRQSRSELSREQENPEGHKRAIYVTMVVIQTELQGFPQWGRKTNSDLLRQKIWQAIHHEEEVLPCSLKRHRGKQIPQEAHFQPKGLRNPLSPPDPAAGSLRAQQMSGASSSRNVPFRLRRALCSGVTDSGTVSDALPIFPTHSRVLKVELRFHVRTGRLCLSNDKGRSMRAPRLPSQAGTGL